MRQCLVSRGWSDKKSSSRKTKHSSPLHSCDDSSDDHGDDDRVIWMVIIVAIMALLMFMLNDLSNK